MTREAINELKKYTLGKKNTEKVEINVLQLNRVIKALEQEPCEDAISRQAVEKITWEEPSYSDALNVLTEVRDKVRALPPVTPQSKIGRWILQRIFPTKLYDEHLNEYECSECGRRIRCTESQLVNYPYCHCGAKMVEPQEREA